MNEKFKIIHIGETDSTNRWLMQHGDSPCNIVVADFQTAGKGCGSNTWESERGKNLTFSMLIHPEELPASRQFRITEVTSVALCETLDEWLSGQTTIKWPNDIYVGDRKLCGMLIENRLQGITIKDSIIGIGLNVNQRDFLSDAPNPVSLCQLLDKELSRETLLEAFLMRFRAVWNRGDVSFCYRQRLYRKDEWQPYSDAQGPFTAMLTDVLPDGKLLLVDNEDHERTYHFKEVQFVQESQNPQITK